MKVLLDMPREVLENPHGYCCYTLADHIKHQRKPTLNDVLDTIKVEIKELEPSSPNFINGYYKQNVALNKVLEVIDKYMDKSDSKLVVDIFGELHEIKSEDEPNQIAYNVGGHTYGVIGGDEIMKEFEGQKTKDIKMRDATPEERASISKYINSISKITDVNLEDKKDE